MSALLWLGATVLAYLAALIFARRVNAHPLANPVLIASLLVIASMLATDTGIGPYMDGGQWLLFLLGPATVALAVPLFRNWSGVRRAAGPLFLAISAGSLTAVATALATAWALGAEIPTLLSLAPKSVTTPIAMGIAHSTGGLQSLAAAIVIVTGIIGAVIGPWLLNRLGIRDPQAQGVALGTAAHGIGTARAFQQSEESGTFSGVAMGVNGIATALVLPWLLIWLFG
ncbi:LrgB family protein [Pyruvatibacter sp.]|uniref:LrgB family protein n=1 Tax=Pyruvatibacter sp. TaxID=1981328 RepID=UPI0032EB2AAB